VVGYISDWDEFVRTHQKYALANGNMPDALPNSVRYVKNGAGGEWWRLAKTNGQIHLGWPRIPDDLLHAADLAQIEALIRKEFGAKRGATQDFTRCGPC
jgi:hypothetical protein